MSLWINLQQMGVICILVAIGIGLKKRGVVDEQTSRKLSAIVVDICNPALIMASILDGKLTASHADLLRALGVGAAFYALLVVTGLLLPCILGAKGMQKRDYHLMSVYTNVGFLGIPLARAILPPKAILYVIVINVFYSLLFYTHGMAVLGASEGRNLRRILNPGMIMAVLSLVITWFGIGLPPILAGTVSYVGNATVFLSMVLLGFSISWQKLKAALKEARIWAFFFLRMILLPIGIVFLMRALGFDRTAILAMCLMTAVPVGNLPMIQAEKMGQDTRLLSSAIAMTTTLSVISITLLIALASLVAPA
ncbi:MAG: AEC family transporter [Lachnospiraceae bacterium]|nr:AEC family transporter [Lachnospiraceae bacterium]